MVLVALLAAVVAFAFVVEASLGFGATLITVTLGAALMPLPELLPAFVPLNIAVSAILVRKGLQHVDGVLLWRRILPWMLAGVPLGLAAFLLLDTTWLARLLGAVVGALALRELLSGGATIVPPTPAARRTFLALGGAMHGAFGAGGPFVVYVLGRGPIPKETFRATLAVLWILLNVVLVVTYLARGLYTPFVLGKMPVLAAAAALGLWLGDRLFRRLAQDTFRRLVFVLLLVAGTVLAIG